MTHSAARPTAVSRLSHPDGPRVFDGHFHIIDPRFPLAANAGFLPAPFTADAYLEQARPLGVIGGALVSGSFHAYDQSYLEDALARLGPGFVGVTQLPAETTEQEIHRLDGLGVRALRFNLRRGLHPDGVQMLRLAQRAFDTAGWHVELYLDAEEIPSLSGLLAKLPTIGIDHLGLTGRGLPHVLRLVERGAWVKASGFGRVDFPIAAALRAIVGVNPDALIFGTDLPCTRTPRPFAPADLDLIVDALEQDSLIRGVLHDNAVRLYRPRASGAPS
ncbi:MAG: amidohydrolase family protein [Pseudomonadota bacterium]|nr:amidohydrolase family protein [Pseudomonadota bacterium]